MDLLLDTNAFLWWLSDDSRLGAQSRSAIGDPANAVHVSAATAWEIAVKRASGKLHAPGEIASWVTSNAFTPLPIDIDHAIASAELPRHHSDPFDRLLIGQAELEKLVLVTPDDEIVKYGVATLDAHS